MSEVRVVGLSETLKKIDSLERRVRRKFVRRSATKGARIVTRAVSRNAPRSGGGLKKSIDSKIVVYPGAVVAIVGQNKAKARKSKAHQKAVTSGKFANKGGITQTGEIVPIHLVDQPIRSHTVRARIAKVLHWFVKGRGRRGGTDTFRPMANLSQRSGARFMEASANESLPQARSAIESDLSEQLRGV